MPEIPLHKFPSRSQRSLGLDPVLDEVRKSDGLARLQLPFGDPCFVVTGYDDARQVYSDKRFSRTGMASEAAPRLTAGVLLQGAIGGQSDSDHLKLRKATLREMDSARIDRLEARAESIMAELLSSMAANGGGDYVSEIAKPFAVAVLCELLGLPRSDHDRLTSWVSALLNDSSVGDATVENHAAVAKDVGQYVLALIRERRVTPGDDLISALAGRRDELNTREVATIVFALIIGGFETTAHMLSKFVLRLLSQPDLWATLRARPESIAAAVEELLRTTSIAGGEALPWEVREPVTLAGVEMCPGQFVLPAVGAANLDPIVFDEPEKVDFDRAPKGHLTFGFGSHFCLGSTIARMELRVALEALVKEYPGAALAVPAHDTRWRQGSAVWELLNLPIGLQQYAELSNTES
ncbi:cytochrome P450 [Nocardia sp. CA-136227]|uniref:cytochrome P450 n=1 Tax=Nocardia sp. CA-136227 TaxID=3239979 RepID=UPI003D97F313